MQIVQATRRDVEGAVPYMIVQCAFFTEINSVRNLDNRFIRGGISAPFCNKEKFYERIHTLFRSGNDFLQGGAF